LVAADGAQQFVDRPGTEANDFLYVPLEPETGLRIEFFPFFPPKKRARVRARNGLGVTLQRRGEASIYGLLTLPMTTRRPVLADRACVFLGHGFIAASAAAAASRRAT
jgi:hypothetical protein